jgi:16S rRNA (cytosine967-C5)-methyltransferase
VAAIELLHMVLEENADLESALERSAAYGRLDGSDRGFARAMASAVLRGLGRLHWALGALVDRPLDQVEAPVRLVLLVGCAQLWMMGVAEHAAVAATVEAARKWEKARRGGAMVNAVLRRAARERETFDAAPAASVWPDWLAAKMKAALGKAQADALALLQTAEPAIDLTLKPGENAQAWADRLQGEELANGSVRLATGAALSEMQGYAEGVWWVQDAGASLAAKLLGDVRGKAVADLCAAPGGKSMQLAAAGAELIAVDISRQRLALVRENAARLKLEMEIVEADARDWRPAEKLDAVLLDAPCSALGVLRRHPEGAWRRDPADLARFPKIQAALVKAAGEMLKPGGLLVYCVCTPSPEEGREVIAAALAGGGWRRLPVEASEAPGFVHALTTEGDLLTAPPARAEDSDAKDAAISKNVADPLESDVFFIARLEKTG